MGPMIRSAVKHRGKCKINPDVYQVVEHSITLITTVGPIEKMTLEQRMKCLGRGEEIATDIFGKSIPGRRTTRRKDLGRREHPWACVRCRQGGES